MLQSAASGFQLFCELLKSHLAEVLWLSSGDNPTVAIRSKWLGMWMHSSTISASVVPLCLVIQSCMSSSASVSKQVMPT